MARQPRNRGEHTVTHLDLQEVHSDCMSVLILVSASMVALIFRSMFMHNCNLSCLLKGISDTAAMPFDHGMLVHIMKEN